VQTRSKRTIHNLFQTVKVLTASTFDISFLLRAGSGDASLYRISSTPIRSLWSTKHYC
jgi:hypothetical protein